MKKYKAIEVTEKHLEDLVRQGADLIEEGLRYIDHQRRTQRGPLDVLMVDSGNSAVVAELKVVEDDAMLVQGIDYYDYVNGAIEGMARVYKDFHIDPSQPVRLFLIAPAFSVSLLNRCKWIDIPISLFTYKCVAFEDSKDVIPIFSEVTIPSAPEPPKPKTYSIEERLKYITNSDARKLFADFLDEIKAWNPQDIAAEPTKYDVSLKVSGTVFCYMAPRRKYFMVYTNDREDNWTGFPVHQKQELGEVRSLVKANMEKRRQM